MSSVSSNHDPLAIEGPYIKKSYIWFFAVAILASVMTWQFCKIDRRWYDREGKYLDYDMYRANRTAATSIPSESIDERKVRALISAVHVDQNISGENASGENKQVAPNAHGASSGH